MKNVNVRTFKKVIRELTVGDSIYINAISCSEKSIDFLRECVESKVN